MKRNIIVINKNVDATTDKRFRHFVPVTDLSTTEQAEIMVKVNEPVVREGETFTYDPALHDVWVESDARIEVLNDFSIEA